MEFWYMSQQWISQVENAVSDHEGIGHLSSLEKYLFKFFAYFFQNKSLFSYCLCISVQAYDYEFASVHVCVCVQTCVCTFKVDISLSFFVCLVGCFWKREPGHLDAIQVDKVSWLPVIHRDIWSVSASPTVVLWAQVATPGFLHKS